MRRESGATPNRDRRCWSGRGRRSGRTYRFSAAPKMASAVRCRDAVASRFANAGSAMRLGRGTVMRPAGMSPASRAATMRRAASPSPISDRRKPTISTPGFGLLPTRRRSQQGIARAGGQFARVHSSDRTPALIVFPPIFIARPGSSRADLLTSGSLSRIRRAAGRHHDVRAHRDEQPSSPTAVHL